MKRKILMLLCLILFFVSIAGVSATQDLNQTIDGGANDLVSNEDTLSVSLSDDNVLETKDDGSFTSLQKKIDDAPEGSTIFLENDYSYDETKDSDYRFGVRINKEISINGAGHTIDGVNKASILYIFGENVRVDNINFINGNTTGCGAAIHSKYSFNIGNNNTFYNNKCNGTNQYSGYGGAVFIDSYNSGQILSIGNNNKFINNSASEGGAIWAQHVYMGDYNTFHNNSCDEIDRGDGGAIYCKGNLDFGCFNNFTFNTALNKGGAIYSLSHTYMENNNLFLNNHASDGGAIYCSSINAIKASFINNSASNNGGAINAHHVGGFSTYLNITYSIFDANVAEKSEAILLSTTIRDLYGNFWGSNNPDFNSLLGGWSPDYYIKLDISDGNAIKGSDTEFNLYLNHLLPDYSVGLSATKGTIKPKNVKISDGSGSFILNTNEETTIGVYNNEGSLILSKNIKLSSINLDVPNVTKDYGGPERLEITLTENNNPISNADVKINLNGVDYPKTTDSNGKASIAINLPANTYIATVSYKDVSTTARVTVNQLTSKTALSSSKNSHNSVTLTAAVSPSTATGDVVFNVNGKDYPASKISDAKASYTLDNLAVGSYDAKATYRGDVNHKASTSSSVKFTVEDVKVDVRAPDLTKYYKGPEKFVVTVKENNMPLAGKEVTIVLNGKPYTRTTDSNGQASMAINLNSGIYNVTSQYEDIKVDSTITIKSTVSGSDVTKIFRNGTQYYATFVDTKGNLMKNTEVKFNINGIFYTKTTNDEGVAKMNINLPPGTYILTAENPDSTEKYTNVINVLPSIVENHDLTKYYRNESKYTLRILGDDGKPVGEGVVVKLNINGVFYERKTNASGYMGMNINLPPGKYTVTAEYNGLRASNTITVLSVLETNDLKMSYKDGSKFEAKILDGQGKPYVGQTVTFNINGIFYQKTTGDDGVARLTINLIAGEYIITSTYNGLNAANKVTISS
ncbi:MAG: Ig-like domain repeat protein [Methanobrevibacter sp.]|nr:Ig-like domain repeat protein [Methanobrevibacter sp.]